MTEKVIFEHTSRDAMAQATSAIVTLAFVASFFVGFVIEKYFISLVFIIVLVLAVSGLRYTVKVKDVGSISIDKKWFAIPYRTFKSASIDSVFYSGDWGDPEGANSVVVKLENSREVCIGNRNNMHELFGELTKYVRDRIA